MQVAIRSNKCLILFHWECGFALQPRTELPRCLILFLSIVEFLRMYSIDLSKDIL